MTTRAKRRAQGLAAGMVSALLLVSSTGLAAEGDEPAPEPAPEPEPPDEEPQPTVPEPPPPVAPIPYPTPGWGSQPVPGAPQPGMPPSWDQPPPITPAPYVYPAPPPGRWAAPHPLPVPPDTPETDPLLPAGITLGAVGLLALGGGAIAYGTSSSAGEQLCGLSGCFDRPDNDLKMGGVALMAGGAALAALSVPVIITGSRDETPARKSDGKMITGLVITGVGVASTVGSFAALMAQDASVQASDNDSEAAQVAVPMLLLGGAALAVGLPLWASGGADWEPETIRAPDGPVKPGEEGLQEGVYVERSGGMKVTGIVLTVFGSINAIASAAMFGAAQSASNDCYGECDFSGVGESIMSAGLLAAATLNLGVGIPLWCVGASDELVAPNDPRAIEQRQEANRIRPPELKLSPTSVQLDWRF